MPPKQPDFRTPIRGRKLAPRRARFIMEFVTTGNGAQAVIAAGYKTRNPLRLAGVLRFHLKEYIDQAVAVRLTGLQPVALKTIVYLAGSAKSEAVRLTAAKDIMDRGNHLAGTRHITEPHAGTTDKALWDRICRGIGEARARELFPDIAPPPAVIEIVGEHVAGNGQGHGQPEPPGAPPASPVASALPAPEPEPVQPPGADQYALEPVQVPRHALEPAATTPAAPDPGAPPPAAVDLIAPGAHDPEGEA